MTTDILTAENAVLGACLSDCALWGTVLNALHETDLAGDANRCIFRAARTLDADGKTPDAPAIADLVQQDGIERRYLFELMEVADSGSKLDQSISSIKRAAQLRTLSQLGENIAERARAGDEPNSITGDAIKALDDLGESSTGGLIDSTTAAVDFYNFYDRRTSGRAVYVPTGLAGLDKLFSGGMLDSGLYIMAARPGCCKTTLALQLADTAAQNTGAVLFVTLEMDENQITARRIARDTGIPSSRLLMGTLNEPEMQRVLCLAQLNRASEQRSDKKPTLADLRDSGAIEQDADGVLLLHRPDMYNAEPLNEGQPATVECTLAKHRHGAVGAVELALDLQIGLFVEVRKRSEKGA